MYGPMAHHYGNDVAALTPGSNEGSAHGKPLSSSHLCFTFTKVFFSFLFILRMRDDCCCCCCCLQGEIGEIVIGVACAVQCAHRLAFASHFNLDPSLVLCKHAAANSYAGIRIVVVVVVMMIPLMS